VHYVGFDSLINNSVYGQLAIKIETKTQGKVLVPKEIVAKILSPNKLTGLAVSTD